MQAVRVVLACVVCSIGGLASTADASWSSNGPYGGWVHEIQFVPGTSIGYATTWGGLFRSEDGGDTWVSADRGFIGDASYALSLRFDAEQPATVYTADSWGRMYRSDNAGDTWTILPASLPNDVFPITFADVPGASCALLLGTGTNLPPRGTMLFRTDNCGLDFTQTGAGLPNDVPIRYIGFLPNDVSHSTVLAALDNDVGEDVWISHNGGASFAPISSGPVEVSQFAFGPGNEVWAEVGGYSLAHSLDGGQTWADTGATGSGSVAADPVVSGRAWIASDVGWRVDYDGFTPYVFTRFPDGLTGNASYTAVDASPAPAGVDWLAWNHAVTRQLFATTKGSGIFRFIDDAAPHWQSITRNPQAARIRSVAIHPGNPNVVFAGQDTYSTSSPAFFRSLDGGVTWAASNNGLRAADIATIVVDPVTVGSLATTTIYAGGRAAPNNDELRNHGLYRSDNGGGSWTTLDGDLPTIVNHYADDARSIALDARSCATPPVSGPCAIGSGPLQTVYATSKGYIDTNGSEVYWTRRIVRSDDRGAHWVDLSVNPGFPASTFVRDTIGGGWVSQEVTPTVVVVDPYDSNRLFVGTLSDFSDTQPGNGNEINPSRASGLFYSADRGANWTRLGTSVLPHKANTAIYANATRDVVDLLVDPVDSKVLWVGLSDGNESGTSTIWRSADRGLTWTEVYAGINSNLPLRDLALDPQNPNIVYASVSGFGGNPGGVFRGVWSQATQDIVWLSISIGLPAESALSIAVDPANGNRLHAGTGKGVFSITRQADQDGDGIPDDVESTDGNGDGIFDNLQRDVGTTGVALRPAGENAAATTVMVTSDVVAGSGGTACNGVAPQTVDVSLRAGDAFGLDTNADGRLFYLHPYGVSVFEILGCQLATIRLRYHGADFSDSRWSLRVFGPTFAGNTGTIRWQPIPSATRVAPDAWELPLNANGFGSYRTSGDAIRTIVAPACVDDSVFANGFEATPALSFCN